jgi:CheY-like chemotaxis protein
MHPEVDILLVEDNAGDVRLMKRMLATSGIQHRLSIAQDGVEALSFLRRSARTADAPRPQLILLDLNLPRVDGREVLSAIKADEELRRIPVIVLTSSHAPQDVRSCYDSHANGYVCKPLNLEGMQTMIDHIVGFWLKLVVLPAT